MRSIGGEYYPNNPPSSNNSNATSGVLSIPRRIAAGIACRVLLHNPRMGRTSICMPRTVRTSLAPGSMRTRMPSCSYMRCSTWRRSCRLVICSSRSSRRFSSSLVSRRMRWSAMESASRASCSQMQAPGGQGTRIGI